MTETTDTVNEVTIKGTSGISGEIRLDKIGRVIHWANVLVPDGPRTMHLPMRSYEGDPTYELMQSLPEGRKIIVKGPLQRDVWQNSQGKYESKMYVHATHIELVD
jgi:hypothetical protein